MNLKKVRSKEYSFPTHISTFCNKVLKNISYIDTDYDWCLIKKERKLNKYNFKLNKKQDLHIDFGD